MKEYIIKQVKIPDFPVDPKLSYRASDEHGTSTSISIELPTGQKVKVYVTPDYKDQPTVYVDVD